jgi:HK97 family phage portal protein
MSMYNIPVAAGIYEDWQVLHIPGLGYDGTIGYSPVSMARQAIALGLGAEEFAGRFYANRARPDVVLTAPAGTQIKDPEKLRADWKRTYGGLEHAGEVALLYGGMDVKTFTVAPRDAQFLEGRQFQIAEMARIFNIPPHMLGDPNSKAATYASAEQADLQYAKHTVSPWCERIEQKINLTILASQNALSCRHDMNELYRGDMKTRYEAYNTAILAGWMNQDEARAREDMNPIPDGQGSKYRTQAQMIELGQKPPEPTPAEPRQRRRKSPEVEKSGDLSF